MTPPMVSHSPPHGQPFPTQYVISPSTVRETKKEETVYELEQSETVFDAPLNEEMPLIDLVNGRFSGKLDELLIGAGN